MRSSPSCTIWPWRTGRPYQTGLNQATRRPSRVRRRSLVRPCTAARAGSVRPQAHKAPDGASRPASPRRQRISGKSAFRSPVQMNSPNSPGAVTRPSARTSMRPTSGHRCSVPRSHSLAHATVSLMPYVSRTGHPIAAAFGCPVRETYGMSETVAWASECERGTLHLWPEVGLIEVLADGRVTAPGEFGEFICTGLLNADFPLIRCRLGDAGRLAPSGALCACGRTLPALAAVHGRTNDLLLTRDGRRVAWFNPVWYGLPVRQGQIVQEGLDRVRVRYRRAAGGGDASRRLIVQRVQERVGDVHVVLEEVPEIARGAHGKFRAVVCALPAADRSVVAGRR